MVNKILIALILCFSHSVYNIDQEIEIDLINGTINGKTIVGMPLDSLTNMLGRPSSVSDNFNLSFLGNSIKYHHLGLEFSCKLRDEDKNQSVKSMKVYLSKTWDEDASEFFILNNVLLNPKINSNYKASEVEDQFKQYIFKIVTPEEQEKNRDEIFKKHISRIYTVPPKGGYHYTIYANFQHHSIMFTHEKLTKFLENITIQNKIEE